MPLVPVMMPVTLKLPPKASVVPALVSVPERANCAGAGVADRARAAGDGHVLRQRAGTTGVTELPVSAMLTPEVPPMACVPVMESLPLVMVVNPL